MFRTNRPSSCFPRAASRRKAFTLVELLVVIGIIALLISMLLPALNRARAAANSIACQSQLRQIGQGIHLYANEYKGFLPASKFTYVNANGVTQYPETVDVGGFGGYHIPTVLSRTLGKTKATYLDLSPVFTDRDTPEASFPDQAYPNHYNFNLRLFPYPGNLPTPFTDLYAAMLPITKVKKSAKVVAAYDGQPQMNEATPWYRGNAFDRGMMLASVGGPGVWWSTQGFDTTPSSELNPSGWMSYQTAIANEPGSAGGADFRHIRNTSINVLYLDGHVEAKKKGELKIADFCFNWRGVIPD